MALYIPQCVVDELSLLVKSELSRLTPERQEQFLDEFNHKRKNPWVTLMLTFTGFHYVYLGGRWALTLLYLFTLGGYGFWWLIDIVRMYNTTRNFNRDIAIEVLRTLKIIGGNQLEAKMVAP